MSTGDSIGAWGDLCEEEVEENEDDRVTEEDSQRKEGDKEDWRNLRPSKASTSTVSRPPEGTSCTTADAQHSSESQQGHRDDDDGSARATEDGDIDKDVVVVENVPSDKRGSNFKQEVFRVIEDDVNGSTVSIVWHSVDIAVIIVPTSNIGERVLEGLKKNGYKDVSYYFARDSLPPPKSEKEAKNTSQRSKGPSQRLLMGALGGRRALGRTANENTRRAVQVARSDIRIALKQSDDVDTLTQNFAEISISTPNSPDLKRSTNTDTDAGVSATCALREYSSTTSASGSTHSSKTPASSSIESGEHDVLLIESVPSDKAGKNLESHLLKKDPTAEGRFTIVWHSVDVAALVTDSNALGERLHSKLKAEEFNVRYFSSSEQLPVPKTQSTFPCILPHRVPERLPVLAILLVQLKLKHEHRRKRTRREGC
eukprot:gb/GECG01012682.1/.p1 GENE.gb/GECG01012682.1/~~gb/GECG01012682.1/.p1  ORF type:complete len:427 (+),score=66.65 gb/GECG01012682.1/:1-1281(+)